MEELGDWSLRPKVDSGFHVSAPLTRRKVRRQRKNRIKGCLEGGSGKKTSANESEKAKKLVRGKFKCPTIMSLGIEKIQQSVPSMVKGKYSLLYRLCQVLIVLSIMTYLIPLFMCE
jgi:hypothetical protein